jgi:hypothetical protein
MHFSWLAIVLTLALYLGGCTSPETTRTRGGGPGADVGNRGEVVKMHEGSRPYWETPEIIEVETAPLGSARQAHDLSRL